MLSSSRRVLLPVVIVALLPLVLHGQSLGEIAKKTQEQRDKAKQEEAKKDAAKDPKAAKTYSNKDLPTEASAPVVPADPVADAAESPKREEALVALRAVQSALDGGANFDEFKKYYLAARIKVDVLRNAPANAAIREVSEFYADDVTLKIASITKDMSAEQVRYFRTKYALNAEFLELFRDMPDAGFERSMGSYTERKAAISAEYAGKIPLLLANEKLKAIK